MKNKTKIWLAFLLPLSALSIATPIVLSSCSNSEQAPSDGSGKPDPEIPKPPTPPITDNGNQEGGGETEKPIEPKPPSGGNEDTKPQTPLQPAKIKIKQFDAKNHTRQELLNKYILAELIREFVALPKGTNITQMLAENGNKDLWFPASTSFYIELTNGFLFDFIKTKYIFKDIKSISIANGSKFLILTPTSSSTNGKLYITVDMETTPKQPTHNIAPTNGITRMLLEITPHLTTLKEVEWSNVELTLLNRKFGDTTKEKKDEVVSLYNEFANGNDSILEQTISSHMNSKGGLVSYSVNLIELNINKDSLVLGNRDISFIPFKVKDNYTYIQTQG